MPFWTGDLDPQGQSSIHALDVTILPSSDSKLSDYLGEESRHLVLLTASYVPYYANRNHSNFGYSPAKTHVGEHTVC